MSEMSVEEAVYCHSPQDLSISLADPQFEAFYLFLVFYLSVSSCRRLQRREIIKQSVIVVWS